jgi:peptidyl-prolyl cis-trans isomerase A (cyclophilin A)
LFSKVQVIHSWHNIEMTSHTSVATLHTNHGAIKVNLFGLHAPKTVENFEGLATGEKEWTDPRTGAKKTGTPLYQGVIFHRIIQGFMLQGGDPTGTGMGGPGYQFGDEIHPELNFNAPYMLAMANAGPGTNGSQFFITVAPTTWLQGKHTVFGEVADEVSRKVVDKIEGVATSAGDKPFDDVVLESITIEKV